MANLVAILGESGSGKSTSLGTVPELGLKGLDPKNTVIISTMGKPLPFKGYRSLYSTENRNYAVSRNPQQIIATLQSLNNVPTVKSIVIDDFQYIMSGEFMDKAKATGYQKFSDLAKNVWDILEACRALKDTVTVFILSHTETIDENYESKQKMKTIGKLLDDKVTLEGLFTIVLYAEGEVKDKTVKKWFRTQSNGADTCKSPVGMFDNLTIPNDLGYVLDKINEYYG
jgi:ABC-type dipeptide/oligopeptide/nickel transport system ATPase subunit